MAKYINRQDLIKFLDNIQQPKMPITQGFKFITIDDAIKVVSERPTADVIERFKIDKALKEMEKLKIQADFIFMNDYADGYKSGLDEAVEILKRNIGE